MSRLVSRTITELSLFQWKGFDRCNHVCWRLHSQMNKQDPLKRGHARHFPCHPCFLHPATDSLPPPPFVAISLLRSETSYRTASGDGECGGSADLVATAHAISRRDVRRGNASLKHPGVPSDRARLDTTANMNLRIRFAAYTLSHIHRLQV